MVDAAWTVYAWLWSNVPAAAVLVTGISIIFATAAVMSVFEPRHDLKDYRISQPVDPPRPAPRLMKQQTKDQVWMGGNQHG